MHINSNVRALLSYFQYSLYRTALASSVLGVKLQTRRRQPNLKNYHYATMCSFQRFQSCQTSAKCQLRIIKSIKTDQNKPTGIKQEYLIKPQSANTTGSG